MTGQRKEKRRYWLGGNRHEAQDRFFVEALDPALWREGGADDWDSCWYTGMPDPAAFRMLAQGKTINHIPGNNGLTVKSLLYQTLAAAAERLDGHPYRERLGFFPRAYSMPEDYRALQRDAAKRPGKNWILKPKRSSRGRGIEVISDIGAMPVDSKWMVQEYLDDPHLYNGHKYVLRCYVLITSVEPLRVYFYREGFAKLASMPYAPDDIGNLYAHLTNPDVNALNEEVEDPVVFISFSRYREWLKDEGHDDCKIFEGLHEIAALCAIAVRERMRERLQKIPADTSGCYELLGLDCMLDAQLNPWLLECNLSPSLEVCAEPDAGGDEEAAIKRAVVADFVAMLGLNEERPDFSALGEDARMIAQAEWELARAGGYERVFPAVDSGELLKFFPVPRYGDVVLAGAASGAGFDDFRLQTDQTRELILGEELALFSEKTKRYYAPNPMASWIWLKAAEGAAPDAIADELGSIAAAESDEGAASPERNFRKEVWEALADWGREGLIGAVGAGTSTPPPPDLQSWAGEDLIAFGGRTFQLRYGAPEIAGRLDAILAPLRTDARVCDESIDILVEQAGYAIACGPRLSAAHLKLSAIAPAVQRLLLQSTDTARLNAAYLALDAEHAVLVASGGEGGWDAVAAALSKISGARLCGGFALLDSEPGRAAPVPLPCWVGDDLGADSQPTEKLQFHDSARCGRGVYVPVSPDGTLAPRRVSAVIIPKLITEGEIAETSLETITGPDALVQLGAYAGNGDAATRLGEWAGAVNVAVIGYKDPMLAARAVWQEFSGTK